VAPYRLLKRLCLLAVFAVTGCATTDPSPQIASAPSLDACCERVETAPPLFVRIIDPVAPMFGRAVALVVWRKGYLHGERNVHDALFDELQPLDILLVSNKGRLSNVSLPGYFIHAAVYLGNEEELKRAGVWNAPEVAAYREAIRSGQRFIEADNRGVHLSPPRVTLNADRVLVVRPRGLSTKRKREALADFFDAVGGRFDFHFDAETPDCLFCIELVQKVIPEIALPLREAYGRKVIVPDDLARNVAQGRPPVSFVTYVRGDQNGWQRASREDLRRDLANNWNH